MGGRQQKLFGSFFGLVRDGAAWGKDHAYEYSTDAWYMSQSGSLYGNEKEDYDCPVDINDFCVPNMNDSQIVSMEADLDKGTLRFWLDGKQHGLGWSSGVTGRLRWAVSLFCCTGRVEIVPTPELGHFLG